MFSTASRSLLILTLAACAASIAGCGKTSGNEEPADTPAAASEQPAAAKVHYWKSIAPFVAGAYSAQCLPAAPPELYADTLTITPEGRVTATGVNEDLAQATSIVLGRATDKGLTENVMLAEVGEFPLNMMINSDGGKAVWSALKKNKSAICEQSSELAGLKGKYWVTALAPVLTTLPRTIKCIASGNIKQELVNFRLTGNVATIHQENFALKEASQKSVIFSDGLSTLQYSATFPDRRVLRLEYNTSVKLANISGNRNNDQLDVCETS